MERSKVYLATAWHDKDTIRHAAEVIAESDLQLNARWVDLALGGKEYGDASIENIEMAEMDLEDLDGSDGVLLIPNREMGTGHHIEFGYALARNKPIVIAGEGWTVFHALSLVEPTVPLAVELLHMILVQGA